MRADRLVAILLMLQTKGLVTAAQVADELEISERTARRDLDALGAAGLPIYSQQGRGGGWRLVGGGKTDLSGLTAAEARALFLVAGRAAGSPTVKAALRKLVRALPEPFRDAAEAATSAVVVDPTGWDQVAWQKPMPTHLDAVQRAIVEGEQVRLGYVARTREPTERVVHPLGLAAKGPNWYLVAHTEVGQRTFRVDRITSVEPTGEAVVRPPGFDLTEAWQSISDQVGQLRSPVRARALAAPQTAWILRHQLGTRLSVGPTAADGRVEVELRGHHVGSLAGEIAGFGASLEVLEPQEVRQELARIGAELTTRYGEGAA